MTKNIILNSHKVKISNFYFFDITAPFIYSEKVYIYVYNLKNLNSSLLKNVSR